MCRRSALGAITARPAPSGPAGEGGSSLYGPPREFERLLVDQGGFSRNAAKAIAASGFRGGVDLGELEDAEEIKAMLRASIKKISA